MKIRFIFPIIALSFIIACNSDPLGGEDSLADQMVGTYVGVLQNPTTSDQNYSVTVTKISDTEVKFAPTSGSSSAIFKANLTEETTGSIKSLVIISPDDILATNGSFVNLTGRLSYTFHLGGLEQANIEVFIGTKQ